MKVLTFCILLLSISTYAQGKRIELNITRTVQVHKVSFKKIKMGDNIERILEGQTITDEHFKLHCFSNGKKDHYTVAEIKFRVWVTKFNYRTCIKAFNVLKTSSLEAPAILEFKSTQLVGIKQVVNEGKKAGEMILQSFNENSGIQ